MNYYPLFVKHRNSIVRVFTIVNIALAILWFYASIYPRVISSHGGFFGRFAVIFYILTVIPGIFRRFGISAKPVAILMMFRRQTGIMTFMLALIHSSIKWFFPSLLFKNVGIFATFLLFFLFITSNNWSVRKLGSRWHRIHSMTYAIIVLLFFHLTLQRISIWTILVGITLLAQLTSHIYATRKVL